MTGGGGEEEEETAEPPLTWRDSLPDLLNAASSGDAERVASLCVSASVLGDGDGDGDGDDRPPADVLLTLRTAHVRSLFLLGRWREALSVSEELGPRLFPAEVAYARYRSGDYAGAADLCRSALDARAEPPPQGLLHVHAQSLYRLGMTDDAMGAYRSLRETADAAASAASAFGAAAEEREDVWANHLANEVSNATCGGGPEEEKEEGGAVSHVIPAWIWDSDSHDLRRNAALLLLSSAASSADLRRVARVLAEAEEDGRSALLSGDGEGEGGGLSVAEVDRELAPLLADRAVAEQLLGERNGPSRTYLALLAGEGEVAHVAAHNLALLTGKALPPSLPGNWSTPTHIRTVLCNRALLALRSGRHSECREELEELRRSVHGGAKGREKVKKGGKAQGKPKGEDAAFGVPPPRTEGDRRLWEAHISLLESEILRAEGRVDEAAALVQESILRSGGYGLASLLLHRYEVERRASAKSDPGTDDDDGDERGGAQAATQDPIEVLEGLPMPVASRPAVLGALAALHSEADDEESVTAVLGRLSSRGGVGGGGSSARIRAAAHSRAGRHGEAADILRDALRAEEEGHPPSGTTTLDLTARLVAALSYIDPEGAVELARSLPMSDSGDDGPDGEALELMETPRLGKDGRGGNAGGVGEGSGGSKECRERRERREVAARRRARRRERYLEALERAGKYDPTRPAKADPERWIPKHQRSYGRRGRRGRGRHVGAQGGGAGAGHDRDASRLDAKARADAMRQGTVGWAGSRPSTAHMKVSAGGGRKGGRR